MPETTDQPAISQADVAAILAALRSEVRSQRIAQGQLEPAPLERDLQRSLDEIELYRVISAHWPLIGKTLPQRAIALVNKLVRRYLRWYINPIVEQQNAANAAITAALLAGIRLDAERRAQVAALRAARAGMNDANGKGSEA
ncbi:hypothetical protein SE17_22575 [Kouleothrix aurantiaca]|uniref:Uncharacterized protein n=1 Tax=Kouleothrix aurantiaca TaxID=186479 RepID=A0A0P9CXY0_9CHLR|nr:hypothetical protein SE17_22575 [Kouleothrix aurantiaca]